MQDLRARSHGARSGSVLRKGAQWVCAWDGTTAGVLAILSPIQGTARRNTASCVNLVHRRQIRFLLRPQISAANNPMGVLVYMSPSDCYLGCIYPLIVI